MSKAALRVPVSDLSGPVERRVRVRASHIDLEPPETQIDVHATVTKCGKEALIEGSVRAGFSVPCASCLDPAPVRIDEVLKLSVRVPGDGEINLVGPVRDAFMEGVPMKVTCSPDCRGLCAKCGANLNREACSCGRTGKRKGSLGVALDEALDRGES
jgi:uncharacterized metal-binding protein YceD (DUF177 family)